MSDKEKRADQYHFHDVTLFMEKKTTDKPVYNNNFYVYMFYTE